MVPRKGDRWPSGLARAGKASRLAVAAGLKTRKGKAVNNPNDFILKVQREFSTPMAEAEIVSLSSRLILEVEFPVPSGQEPSSALVLSPSEQSGRLSALVFQVAPYVLLQLADEIQQKLGPAKQHP